MRGPKTVEFHNFVSEKVAKNTTKFAMIRKNNSFPFSMSSVRFMKK